MMAAVLLIGALLLLAGVAVAARWTRKHSVASDWKPSPREQARSDWMLNKHPVYSALMLGAAWGLIYGGVLAVWSPKHSPLVTLATWVVVGTVVFGPAVIWGLRRRQHKAGPAQVDSS